MPGHPTVLAGVARALVPGGRFVGEFGGTRRNVAIVVALGAVLRAAGSTSGARFTLDVSSTTEVFQGQLEAAGFAVESIVPVPRPTPLPTGMRGWLATFANPFFAGIDEPTRAEMVDEAVALLEPALRDANGNWIADYVRLRFRATLTR